MKNVDQECIHCMNQGYLINSMAKGENIMVNMTHNPQTQQDASPYTFQLSWRGEPKIYVIHYFRDLNPQEGEYFSPLEEKEHLLHCLVEHVGSVTEEIRTQEHIHVLTKLVAALDDEETFKHLLVEEDFFL